MILQAADLTMDLPNVHPLSSNKERATEYGARVCLRHIGDGSATAREKSYLFFCSAGWEFTSAHTSGTAFGTHLPGSTCATKYGNCGEEPA